MKENIEFELVSEVLSTSTGDGKHSGVRAGGLEKG